MKHRQFIRNAAFYMSLALPMGFLSAGTGCGEKDASSCASVCKKAESKVNTQEAWDFLPDVVASYGDKNITRNDFIKEVSEVMKMLGGQQIPPTQLKKMAPMVAQGMVEKAILLGLADKSGVKASPELVVSEFEEMYKSMPEEQKEMFKTNLKQNGSSVDEYKVKMSSNANAQRGIAIEKYVQSNFTDKLKVSDNEAEKFYNEKGDVFKTPESVSASHILIRPENETPEAKAEAKKQAEVVLTEVRKAPETFEKVAEAKSACPSGKASKGSLGEFGRGQMVPEFEEVAFKIEPNVISDIVETRFGYHIIKVTDKKESGQVPYEKVKEYIKKQLTGEKVQKALQEVLDKEKERLNVKINV